MLGNHCLCLTPYTKIWLEEQSRRESMVACCHVTKTGGPLKRLLMKQSIPEIWGRLVKHAGLTSCCAQRDVTHTHHKLVNKSHSECIHIWHKSKRLSKTALSLEVFWSAARRQEERNGRTGKQPKLSFYLE